MTKTLMVYSMNMETKMAAESDKNELGRQSEHLKESIDSVEFNLTNGMERRFLEGEPEAIKNFEETKAVFINNFLELWLADRIHSVLAVETPSDWWSYVTSEIVGRGVTERPMPREVYQIFAENKTERDSMWYEAMRTLKEKKFGYSYSYQKGNYPGQPNGAHGDECTCFICHQHHEGIFRPKGEFEGAMSKLIGEPVTVNGLQWTRYRANDFLAPHTDDGNGHFAFVYNVTKDWHPIWGGNLTFFNEDGYISDTAPVVFNSLAVWEVGGWHGVTPVIPTIQQSRYAISGWLALDSQSSKNK